MTNYQLKFQIFSYWHVGTGQGSGQLLDSLVQKNPENLSFLPGSSVKGLVRDAVFRAELWERVTSGTAEKLFGNNQQTGELTRFEASEGCLNIDNAELPRDARDWFNQMMQDDLEKAHELSQQFYHDIHTTAIDHQTGAAKHQSLRGREVSIPVTLFAPIGPVANHSEPKWHETIKYCLPLIRGLGGSRTRGLARCKVSLEEVGQ